MKKHVMLILGNLLYSNNVFDNFILNLVVLKSDLKRDTME